jgi:hypothetical protein
VCDGVKAMLERKERWLAGAAIARKYSGSFGKNKCWWLINAAATAEVAKSKSETIEDQFA